jgi:hypothetical protein
MVAEVIGSVQTKSRAVLQTPPGTTITPAGSSRSLTTYGPLTPWNYASTRRHQAANFR